MAKSKIIARIRKWHKTGKAVLGEWWLIEVNGIARSGMAYAKFLPADLPRMLEAMKRLGIKVEIEEMPETMTDMVNPKPVKEAAEVRKQVK